MKKIKVIHLTTFNGLTGAGISTIRLNEALNNNKNINSSVISLYKNKTNLSDYYKNYIFFKKIYNFIDLILFYKKDYGVHFSSGLFGVSLKKIEQQLKNADFIHIHWVQNNFISIKTINQLISKYDSKLVFHLHDTWLFTGGCHINLDCEKYKTDCSNCPKIKSVNRKIPKYLLNLKKRKLNVINNAILVPPSKSHKSLLKQSFLKDKNIQKIPNTLNTDVFYKKSNCSIIPSKKNQQVKYILFGALDIKNKYKGFSDLLEIIKIMKEKNQIIFELILFGENTDKFGLKDKGITTHFIGKVENENDLANVYSNVDLYVTTSYQESFGQTVTEALSCGTPVVCYDNSSPAEIVLHQKNGYIAPFKDYGDFAHGITFCLQNLEKNDLFFNQYVKNNYGYKNVSDQYLSIYLNTINS